MLLGGDHSVAIGSLRGMASVHGPGGAIGEPLRATYSVEPSGLTRMPRGRFPTGIVATTCLVATSTTLMVPLVSLVT